MKTLSTHAARHSLLTIRQCAIFAGAALALGALGAQSAPQTLKLGTRTFTSTEKTLLGTPVIPMWKAQMPTSNQAKACGFPVLKDARHVVVWRPSDLRDGAFNHYATLIFHNGRFYAMWGNHWHGEDGPGQRVLYSSSEDGIKWAPPAEIFPPPGPILPRGEDGPYMNPDRWVEVDGKLYAVAYVHRPGSYPIARELAGDGTLGEPFLVRDLPAKATLPKFMPAPLRNPEIAAKINKWYGDNDAVSWWSRVPDAAGERIPARGVDGAKLIESFAFRSKHGKVAFFRDYSFAKEGKTGRPSNRIYASFDDGKGGWSVPYPTDIPDSHSRAHALTLPDGRVLLVGNQVASRFDSGLFLSREPLTLAVSPDGEFFTKVFALRTDVLKKHRFSNITGRLVIGYGYPSMIVHNGMIYVLYSVNKEDMVITSVPLGSIQ